MRLILRASKSVECLLCRLPGPKLQPTLNNRITAMNFNISVILKITERLQALKVKERLTVVSDHYVKYS